VPDADPSLVGRGSPDTDRTTPAAHAMNETAIPCADCGNDLVERLVDVQEVPVSTDWHGQIRIAECKACGAQYYPEQTVTRLGGRTNDSYPSGDT
jgi:hypothetical protein